MRFSLPHGQFGRDAVRFPAQCQCWQCGREYIYSPAAEKFTPPCDCADALPMIDDGAPPLPELDN